MESIRRFIAYYRPYRGLFFLDFTCAVVAGVLELAFPFAVNQFVDRLLPSGNWALILAACAGLLGIYALNTTLQYVVTYWGHMLGINIETDLRRHLFDHLQKLSFRFFDNHKTGQLLGRITNDLSEIGEVAHHGPEDLFIAVMTFCGAFGLMYWTHPQLALLTFLVVPVLGWCSVYFSRKMTRTYRQLFRDVGEFNARIEDAVGGIRVVQAFANEAFERRLFDDNNRQYRRTKLDAYNLMARSHAISYVSMRLTSLFVMLAGTWFVLRGELTYGQFVAFLLYAGVFFRPIEKINAVIESYPKGIAGFRRYLEIMDTAPDIADRPGAVEVRHVVGEIRLDNVSFGYDAANPVLRDVNLILHPGETVALVGPSGAGKTTLCSLLPRFYDVSSGRITLDGRDIRDLTLASLRRQIGIVQQDVFLFSGSIAENIRYGRLEASDAEVWDAARRARLGDFIAGLPDGLDTVVGERGVKLSGGQKQRIAIARMFLKNPPILILDEATSALDTETEVAIQQALAELARGRTTLVIAHRLATIRGADRIVVVDAQGVVEQGSHQELLSVGGAYSRLHRAQFGVAV